MDSRVCLCLYHWLNLPKTRSWRAWAVFSCRPLRQQSAVACPSLSLANNFQQITAALSRILTLIHWPLTAACQQSSARVLCTCAIKCKCRFYVSALHDEAFPQLTKLTSEHQVTLSKRQSGGPLIYCKCEFGAEKEIFDRLQQMLRYPGTLLFSWRQELRKGNACVPKD